ncbi:VirD4-like conjugal transfer protein, CD1115 family [Lactococcus petauri]|uniref:VirD4-like conjugal transfer protein, CD1115 family n=1 Tax=Lactococcus petauri TaxID=1940789 RepID=UPI001F59A001|nr:type IV secretory system conjugative DNA transfer family protein [Lactococcus petauri]
MQIYKKNVKHYLILSLVLGLVGWWWGNVFTLFPGYTFGAKEMAFFNGEVTGDWLVAHFFDGFIHASFAGMFTGLTLFVLGFLFYVKGNDRGVYRNGEEHGSAKWATVGELLKYRDEDPQNNMILSKNFHMGLFNKRLPQKLQKNKSTVVLGDTGAAKTLSFIMTNIMQGNASFVVTDPDGGLVHVLGFLLSKIFKYEIKVLDLNTLTNSDQFNVFNYIKTELDVDRVLEAITEGTKEGEQQGEEFWIKAEALLIRSFIAYLWFDGKDNNYTPHLGMIADMLRVVKRQDPKVPSPVEEWFEEQNKKHPDNYAYRQWTLFNDLYEAETRASVLGIASARYSVFDHEQVRDIVRKDTMDIEKWNEEKTAVFIAIPETNSSYNFIAAIFMATIMEELRFKSDQVRLGKRQLAKGKALLHVRFLIDEFANIGRIPNFEKALASFRKREMSFAIILQSLAQLRKMYKNNWEEIVDNCSTLLYLGGDDPKTLEFLSKRLGKQTISVRDPNGQRGRQRGKPQGRDLMTVDEIASIDGDECLVFVKKEHGLRDRKYYAFEHPYAQYLAQEPGDENWYDYKRYMSECEKWKDDVAPEQMIDHGKLCDVA